LENLLEIDYYGSGIRYKIPLSNTVANAGVFVFFHVIPLSVQVKAVGPIVAEYRSRLNVPDVTETPISRRRHARD
jgi:hypothetical protein